MSVSVLLIISIVINVFQFGYIWYFDKLFDRYDDLLSLINNDIGDTKMEEYVREVIDSYHKGDKNG